MLPGNDERKISMTNRVKVILTLKDGENKMQKSLTFSGSIVALYSNVQMCDATKPILVLLPVR
jgi:hypothetical protein